jgi:hypothetical protein
MLQQFLRVIFCDQFTIDLRSICIKASEGFHVVSITKSLEHFPCVYTWCLYGIFSDGVSMQVPWGIDVGFMEVSCKFLNLVAARRPLNPTDEVFMAVPCRCHGDLLWVSWRFHVRFVGAASIYTYGFYHAL